jgi:hypothetical protein
MTGTEKVLQRKDASSVLLAVLLGFITLQFVLAVTSPLSARILGETANLQAVSGKDQYLAPLVSFVLQLIAVEVLVWVVVGLRTLAYPTAAKKRK